MKRTFLTVAIVSALAFAGCGSDGDDDTMATAGGPAVTTPAALDTGFLDKAATVSTKQVELGRLAADQASNAEVKAFAQRMIDDHQRVNDQLRDAVNQRAAYSVGHDAINDARQRLASLSGAAFDRAYMSMMVQDHQEAVRLAQSKTDEPNADPRLKLWSVNTLATLRDHLQQAQDIEAQVKR